MLSIKNGYFKYMLFAMALLMISAPSAISLEQFIPKVHAQTNPCTGANCPPICPPGDTCTPCLDSTGNCFIACPPGTHVEVFTDSTGKQGQRCVNGLPPSDNSKVDIRATHVGQGGVISSLPIYHLFIVYTDSQGNQFYFRGGPGGPGAPPYGTIIGAVGPYVTGTVDFDPNAPSKTLATGVSDSVMNCFHNELVRITNEHVPYQPTGPNSNTVAHTLLDHCGIPADKPVLIAPGWGNPDL
jgi:hypothetical protein